MIWSLSERYCIGRGRESWWNSKSKTGLNSILSFWIDSLKQTKQKLKVNTSFTFLPDTQGVVESYPNVSSFHIHPYEWFRKFVYALSKRKSNIQFITVHTCVWSYVKEKGKRICFCVICIFYKKSLLKSGLDWPDKKQ